MFRRKNPVTRTRDVGKLTGVAFSAVPEWLEGALGLQVGEVPSRLLLPNITPTMEMYRLRPRFIIVPDQSGPQAGFTLDVPDGKEWLLQSISFLFTTDATVVNRLLFCRGLLVGGAVGFGVTTGDYFVTSGNFSQVASTIVSYTIGPTGVVGNVLSAAIPGTRDAIVHAPTPFNLSFFNSKSQIVVIMQNSVAGDVMTGIGVSVWERQSPEAYER